MISTQNQKEKRMQKVDTSVLKQMEIMEENEALEIEVQKYKNQVNLLRIELEEKEIQRKNELALREMQSANVQELEDQITELRSQNEYFMEQVNQLTQKIKNLQEKHQNISLRIDYEENLKLKENEMEQVNEVLKRELEYTKGTYQYLIGQRIDDQKADQLLQKFYSEKDQETTTSYENEENTSKILIEEQKKEIESLKAENEKIKKRLGEMIHKLSQSKDCLKDLCQEIEFYQKKTKIFNRENTTDDDFKKGLQNLENFDKKLKEVYSHCIDLYVNLDKPTLVIMEKKMNDCIFDFKEIKELLLKNI